MGGAAAATAVVAVATARDSASTATPHVYARVLAAGPKTNRGRPSVALDPRTVTALRAWRKQQLAERLAWGKGWADSGLVFTCATPTRLSGWPSASGQCHERTARARHQRIHRRRLPARHPRPRGARPRPPWPSSCSTSEVAGWLQRGGGGQDSKSARRPLTCGFDGRSQPASIRTFHHWLRVQRSSWPGVMPRSGVRGIGGANRVDHGRPRTLPMTSLVSETPGRCRRGPWRLVSEALARQRGISAARRGSVD